jgi:hypothetical protein
MNEHAVCTLPAPAKPLAPDAPKPSMAFVQSVADVNRLAGNVVAGWAGKKATPIIFNDAAR